MQWYVHRHLLLTIKVLLTREICIHELKVIIERYTSNENTWRKIYLYIEWDKTCSICVRTLRISSITSIWSPSLAQLVLRTLYVPGKSYSAHISVGEEGSKTALRSIKWKKYEFFHIFVAFTRDCCYKSNRDCRRRKRRKVLPKAGHLRRRRSSRR